MTTLTRMPVLLAPAFLLALGVAPGIVEGDEPDGEDVQLDEAEVFIEFNSTDMDFGIQLFWDGDPWARMMVEGPDGEIVMKIKTSANVAEQGLTEGFFESAEPPTSVLNMQQFLDRFPEGGYEFEGRTLDGEELEGETDFTHVIPAPPANLWPALGDEVDPSNPLMVTFDAVTQDLEGDPLEPELYEIILETEGDILRVLTMTLEGDVANPSMTVPPQFIDPDTEYKFEVIVQEESGNRTIAETSFLTQR